MATACPLGHLHINEDACVLEPVDDDRRPVPYGQTASRVLVTNLLNVVQPPALAKPHRERPRA